MLRERVILFTLLFIFCYPADINSQDLDNPSLKRNLRYYFSKDTLANSSVTRFDFQLDIRNSFIRDFPVDIYGGNVGIVFRRRYRIGAGYYFISQQFSDHLLGLRLTNGAPYTDKRGVPIPISKLGNEPYAPASQSLNVNYGCINFTYRFFTSRLVDLYIPLEIGYGTFSEKLTDPSGNDFSSLKRTPKPSSGSFWPAQIGVMNVVKVHKWVYVLSAIGYRKPFHQVFDTESEYTNFESQFESYYYRLGLQLQIGKIWKSIHAKRSSLVR